MTFVKSLVFAGLAGAASLAAAAAAPDSLHAEDQRLLRIADPIMAAALPLCDRTMPDLGVALQSIDQYPANAPPAFGAPVAFAAVLPGSAAAAAGIGAGDGLVAIDGAAVAKRPDLDASPLRDSAFAALADHAPGTPLVLGIVRAGEQRQVSIAAPRECRALVEILDDGGSEARSDGRVIQIDYGLAARASDDQLAVIFAHELAHSILHHRERLSAEGVSKGLLGEFGRDARLNRQAEVEADRLSVYLLAYAGIDPRVAPALWRSKFGKRLSGGIFHDAAHPSAGDRARLLDKEIADHLSGPKPDFPADLLATRSDPLS